jgi:hypothetical protein
MKSAFGVEHGISKSYVNGKWVKAVSLSPKQAGKVKAGGQYKKATGPKKSDTEFKTNQTTVLQAARGLKPGETESGGLFTRVKHSGFDRRKNAKIDIQDTTPSFAPLGGSGAKLEASALKVGPKRGGVNLMTTHGKDAASAQTLKHEKAHLAPDRSGYRMHQIARSPKKLMREEGRADAVADKQLNRPSPFKQRIDRVTADPDRSGYAQAAAGRHLSRSAEHVGGTRAGRAAKKVPGLRKVVGRLDESVRGQYDTQIVRPGLDSINRSLKPRKKIEGKHLDQYQRVYERARGQ